jgi:hypothetical protein
MSKQALVSPNEPRETGYRIAQVEPDGQTFEVSMPLFWTECSDDVVADQFWYNPDNQLIEPNPPPSAETNKNTAIGLLRGTDWADMTDIANPTISNPYLTNQQAYFDYRNTVRGYTINPVAGDINWPVQPEPIWRNT